ncbi:DUF3800 domain-containing protein [Candidatus Peregrinibacteria bacterium]|nr:DUF3800 domain-containing protein [Candidatus Peregrinibacteria bacterium]
MDKNYFGFIDESGNSRQERFFGLGLLLIDDEIGDFYDAMKPFYDRACDIARLGKAERVTNLKREGDLEQVAEIARSNRRFELKFKYINHTNNAIYKALVNKYFEFSRVRFCAFVIDRLDPKFPATDLEPWDVYIHRAAMLIANNTRNISPCGLCVLADDLTKPKTVTKSFEQSLRDAIISKLKGAKCDLFGISRLESHSSLLLQVVDIMLGAVMFDFKKRTGLISEKQGAKQAPVAQEIRNNLEAKDLSLNATYHKPNYFSVWQYQKK